MAKNLNEFWANENTIKDLKLYTKLIGFCYISLGFNIFLLYLYCKYSLQYEYSGVVLMLSIVFFWKAPTAMTDPKKENRDLLSTILGGIFHGFITVSGILIARFYLLFIVYGVEVLVVILLLIRNNRYKTRYKKRKR